MDVLEEGPEGSYASDSASGRGRRTGGDSEDGSAEDSGLMVAFADDEFVARGQAQAQYVGQQQRRRQLYHSRSQAK